MYKREPSADMFRLTSDLSSLGNSSEAPKALYLFSMQSELVTMTRMHLNVKFCLASTHSPLC